MNGRQALVIARILCVSMFLAVAVFAVIARVVAGDALLPEQSGVLFQAWIAISAIGFFAWFTLWRRAVAVTRGSAASERIRSGTLVPQGLHRRLVIAWAVLEAVGIAGVVVYMLSGRGLVLTVSLALVAVGIVVSFPRSAWFEPFERYAPHVE